MTTDKCPVCEIRLLEIGEYKRQITHLTEKLEAWREYSQHLAMMVPKVYQAKLDGYQKLKDLGEI